MTEPTIHRTRGSPYDSRLKNWSMYSLSANLRRRAPSINLLRTSSNQPVNHGSGVDRTRVVSERDSGRGGPQGDYQGGAEDADREAEAVQGGALETGEPRR